MKEFWKRFSRNKGAVIGLLVLSLVVILAITAGSIVPGDPFQSVGKPFEPPFGEFLFGTDTLGRDVAAGIVHGARTSLLIGLIATVLAVVVATIIGGFAGYYGGWIDDVLMRITKFFQTIPSFIFAIVLVAILSAQIENIVFAIAAVT